MSSFMSIFERAKHRLMIAEKRVILLEEELGYWLSQYRCECNHTSCGRCRDSEATQNLLNTKETK